MTLLWQKLFDESDLEVYSTETTGNSNLAVTFDFSSVPGRPPHVPASNFFEEIGFDQIHIVTKKDIWYQTPELFTVAKLIMQRRPAYAKLITYGNSMGAYGSLLISGAIAASGVIAFAPQYTVNSRLMPEEIRWIGTTSKIDFIYDELHRHVSKDAKIFIIYDPFCKEDLRHIKLLREHLYFDEVKLPFAGHFPSSYLYEIGCLATTMRYLLFDCNPIPAIAALRRAKRANSSRYFVNKSLALMARDNAPAALRTAHRAYGINPDKPEALEALLSLASKIPDMHAFSHIAIRLLQQLSSNYPQYDGMRQEILRDIRSRHKISGEDSNITHR